MKSTLLAIEELGHTFAGASPVLRNVSLSLAEGEFLTLLGPSGCGKSTILRLVAALLQPEIGEIQWDGGRPPTLGFVFQEATLMPWASVLKNVMLPLKLRGVALREAKGRAETVLASVGLADWTDAVPMELSGGMRMRVSIARAMVTNPKLLLMDEPFAALDEITRFRLNDLLLERVGELGSAVLFVTHSVFEAAYLSDRVALMSSEPGRVCGQVDVAYGLPRSAELRGTEQFASTAAHLSNALRQAGTGPGA